MGERTGGTRSGREAADLPGGEGSGLARAAPSARPGLTGPLAADDQRAGGVPGLVRPVGEMPSGEPGGGRHPGG